ncbi:MAG: site-specific integrase [Geminicoccaceae bacterium]|nr:site-specific integrase [Geminicoccaceae bacterium]
MLPASSQIAPRNRKLDHRAALVLPGPPTGKFDVVHWDIELPGFGLRVLASGARAWVVRYRVGKRQRVVTLGKVAELDAPEARRQAKGILWRAASGHDDQAERQARRRTASCPLAETFAEVAALYLEHAIKGRRDVTREMRTRHLNRDWRPLHRRPLAEVGRREITARLLVLAQEHGPISANRARQTLNAFFAWAMGQGMAEANPVAGTVPPGEERARERTLAEAEIRALWRATDDLGEYAVIVRLLLLTGQRREEVAAMRWEELDFERRLWVLPGGRTKNGRGHEVPLSDQALVILQVVPHREERALLFGRRSGPFSGWSRGKARLDRQMHEALAPPAATPSPWVLHDLRRTCVTGMAELGVAPHVIEAVVNHVSGHKAGVAGVYNRATYAKDKRKALQLWADHLSRIVGERNTAGEIA